MLSHAFYLFNKQHIFNCENENEIKRSATWKQRIGIIIIIYYATQITTHVNTGLAVLERARVGAILEAHTKIHRCC